jgi:hypothetical protein
MRVPSLPLAIPALLFAPSTVLADCAATFDLFLNQNFNLSADTCFVTHNLNQTFYDNYFSAYNGFVAVANSTGHMNTSDPSTMDGPHGLYAAIYCKSYVPLVRSMYQCATDNSCRAGMLADCKNQTSGALSTFLLRESLGSDGASISLNGTGLSCPGVTSCETLFVPAATGAQASLSVVVGLVLMISMAQ